MKRKASSARHCRRTFHQIVEGSRVTSAARAWERAKLASRLRHAMIRSGRHRAACMLGEIKRRAIARVVELLPPEAGLTIDANVQVGLLSIRWNGRGRLHLAATAPFAESFDASERVAG